MTTIKINAITVPTGSGDELAHRFAARAGAVDDAEGFEGFELLRPTDKREQWLVIARWRDEVWERWWVDWHAYADAIAAFIGAPAGSVVTDTNLSTLLAR